MDKSLIINEIKSYLKIKTDTDFASFLGVKQPTVASWRKRNTIDYDLIIAKCNEINANWLLTGKGEMLKNTYTQPPQSFAMDEPQEPYTKSLNLNDLHALFSTQDHLTAVCITNTEGVITYINNDFTRQTGFFPREAVGSTPAALLQRKDFSRETRKALNARFKNQESFYEELTPNYTKAGRLVICKIQFFPLADGYISFANFV